jgi:hypothetical protein
MHTFNVYVVFESVHVFYRLYIAKMNDNINMDSKIAWS